MQCHDRDALGGVAVAHFHDQRDVLEKSAKIGEFLHRADEFLEVFQSGLRLRPFISLPHGGVAALVEDQFGKFGVLDAIDLAAP